MSTFQISDNIKGKFVLLSSCIESLNAFFAFLGNFPSQKKLEEVLSNFIEIVEGHTQKTILQAVDAVIEDEAVKKVALQSAIFIRQSIAERTHNHAKMREDRILQKLKKIEILVEKQIKDNEARYEKLRDVQNISRGVQTEDPSIFNKQIIQAPQIQTLSISSEITNVLKLIGDKKESYSYIAFKNQNEGLLGTVRSKKLFRINFLTGESDLVPIPDMVISGMFYSKIINRYLILNDTKGMLCSLNDELLLQNELIGVKAKWENNVRFAESEDRLLLNLSNRIVCFYQLGINGFASSKEILIDRTKDEHFTSASSLTKKYFSVLSSKGKIYLIDNSGEAKIEWEHETAFAHGLFINKGDDDGKYHISLVVNDGHETLCWLIATVKDDKTIDIRTMSTFDLGYSGDFYRGFIYYDISKSCNSVILLNFDPDNKKEIRGFELARNYSVYSISEIKGFISHKGLLNITDAQLLGNQLIISSRLGELRRIIITYT